jgi:hypothetical protein
LTGSVRALAVISVAYAVFQLADPGCTATKQLANTGGQLDSTLTTGGVLALVLAGLLLSFAMGRTAGWRRWAWPTRWTMLVLFGVTVAVAVAVGILRRTRRAPAPVTP